MGRWAEPQYMNSLFAGPGILAATLSASFGPGAAGLGTQEASRQYTAFETSFGRRDGAARPSVGTGKLNATKRGRCFTYSYRCP